MTRARVGVLGGTFNPIHLGHLRTAEEVVEALALERMLFIPSAKPPHKGAGARDLIAKPEERLAWTRLAIRGNPRFEVDPIELERGGRSFLVDTLRELGERLAPERPVFVLGRDAFEEIDGWRRPEELFALAHFAVTARPPLQAGSLTEWLPACIRDEVDVAPDGSEARHRRAGTWIRPVEVTALDISASAIRARLREGRSVRYLLPEEVREAVIESGVYAPREGA